jgi:hypothetical protein
MSKIFFVIDNENSLRNHLLLPWKTGILESWNIGIMGDPKDNWNVVIMNKQNRNDGILEYWNTGMLGKSSFCGLRSSHYSITPLLLSYYSG